VDVPPPGIGTGSPETVANAPVDVPPPGIGTGSPETVAGAEGRFGGTEAVARSGFRKVAGRRALAISVVSLAWAWAEGPGGALRGVRLAAGAVAPVVVRCPAAEAVLEGRVPDRETVAKAAEALDGDISPISDLRASAAYRRRALKGALAEALTRRIL
jgi:CO/xanthine dehydrogenase FAD-binding subunit